MTLPPTIFVVDDDQAVRDSLGFLMESNGFAVSTYASAAAFIAGVPRDPDGCLLVDIRMPGMGGLELQEELRRNGWEIPVIVITGHGDVSRAVQAMKGGALDFIEKPFSHDILLDSVRHALAARKMAAPRSPAAPAVAARLEALTPRERDVLHGLIAGYPNKVIAFELAISSRTVEIYRGRLMKKMEVRSLSQLIQAALVAGVGTGVC